MAVPAQCLIRTAVYTNGVCLGGHGLIGGQACSGLGWLIRAMSGLPPPAPWVGVWGGPSNRWQQAYSLPWHCLPRLASFSACLFQQAAGCPPFLLPAVCGRPLSLISVRRQAQVEIEGGCLTACLPVLLPASWQAASPKSQNEALTGITMGQSQPSPLSGQGQSQGKAGEGQGGEGRE